jgi:hypothetical protein
MLFRACEHDKSGPSRKYFHVIKSPREQVQYIKLSHWIILLLKWQILRKYINNNLNKTAGLKKLIVYIGK